MPKINVLPKSVAELIAAGEVVERPSSVVKELIENSLDAGATSVTVEIRGGGVKYIRVTDNGCGIDREDVKTAFISHATSKITTAESLESIFTLGFRGEALPSVAAVSRLSMLTKTKDAETGTAFEIEGGEEKSFDEAGCPAGTTIIIRDLFFNTPARMKFLKKDSTEGTYVSDVVAKTAISHPDVKFIFIKDGKQMLSTPGNGSLKDCVYSVFGKDISESLIECEYEYKFIKIKGYISKPLSNRPNRNMQYCFVNGRYVRIPVAAAALDEAYKNRIMVGKFPVCFLFIEIDPRKTDVNVHPAKTEIRFSEDSAVFEAIYYAAKAALNLGDTKNPGVVLKDRSSDVLKKAVPAATQLNFPTGNKETVTVKSTVTDVYPVRENGTVKNVVVTREEIKETEKETSFPGSYSASSTAFHDNSGVFRNIISKQQAEESNRQLLEEQRKRLNAEKTERLSDMHAEDSALTDDSDAHDFPVHTAPSQVPENKYDNTEAEAEEKEINVPELPPFRIAGEIFKTYILVETGGKLLIIDKHAAHERMIFNRLKEKGFSKDSQMLMFPVSVTLSGREYAAVTENLEIFAEGGFTVEDFGSGTVIVRDCPLALSKEDVASLIAEMAGELARGNMKPVPEKLDWLYHSAACRAAVKAGDEMKEKEIEVFVKNLLSDPTIRYCPHGRPVMYELTKHEIEKQFGRV